MNDETRGMLLGLIGVIIFGLTLPATRFVVEYFNPVFIGLGRAVVAAVFAALILVITRQPLPNKSQFLQLTITALGVVIGFPILSAIAMQSLPASHGGVVMGILPLATAVIGALISHEKPSPGFWLSGIAGSVIVVGYSVLQGTKQLYVGDAALLLATLSAAIGYAVGGKLSRHLGGWQVICWALVISVPFIVIPAWLQAPLSWLAVPNSAWLGFLYLALFSQFIGFFFWNKGLALGGIARVSQTQLLQPFVTLLASVMLIGESMDLITLVCAVLVVSVVAIGRKMPVEHKKPL